MEQTWSNALVLALSVYGVICLLKTIAGWLEGKEQTVRVLPVAGHHEDIEMLMRVAAKHGEPFILLDLGMDADTVFLAREVTSWMREATLVNREEFEKMMRMTMKN